MSQGNVEWAGKFAEVWAGRFTEAVEALLQDRLAPDFELHSLYPGQTYRGVERIRQLSANILETWEDYRFETEQIVDLREHVLVLAHVSGRGVGSGVPIDQRLAILCAFEGENAVWAKSFSSEREALEAAGLRE
jgi:ketosteroid isomerase-like protein